MKRHFCTISACLALAGCATGPQPAGYADGSKTVNTPDLLFQSTQKALKFTSTGGGPPIVYLGDVQVDWRTTSDPNVIILQMNGVDIPMNWDSTKHKYLDDSGKKALAPLFGGISADGQLMLSLFTIDNSAANTDHLGFSVAGLATRPSEMPTTGSATYSGSHGAPAIGSFWIVHGTSGNTYANAATNLTADFAAGSISGTMVLTDTSYSTPGFEIPAGGTTLTLNPAAISGNAFSGNWTGNLADLHLSSLGTADYQGAFYGVSAADVGGTLSGQGISADGTTPAWIVGVFMGQ